MARFLLDTNILIDTILFPERLSDKVIGIIGNDKNDILISSASLLEIAIKHIKHPKQMPIDSIFLAKLIKECGYDILPISYDITTVFEDLLLEGIHNDPFDIIMLAQAAIENCILLTRDSLLSKYKNGNTMIA